MQFATATVLAAFLAFVQAAPTPQSAKLSSPHVVARSSINNCGDSSFINQSSGGSPRVSDCQQIARNIAGRGTWEVEDFTGSCWWGNGPLGHLPYLDLKRSSEAATVAPLSRSGLWGESEVDRVDSPFFWTWTWSPDLIISHSFCECRVDFY